MAVTQSKLHHDNLIEGIFTLRDAYDYGVVLLEKKGIDEANANVEIYLSDLLGCRRSELSGMMDSVMSSDQMERYNNFVERRLTGEPLQYIMGGTNFYGYDIKLNPSVLIPRPETELLVEKVLEDIKISGKTDIRILEVGTGSGCITIALGRELRKMEINYHITAIDVSIEAVQTPMENLVLNNLADGRIDVKYIDVLTLESIDSISKDINYLVSNPPYIPAYDYTELPAEILEYEPKVSLTDNSDGLTFYQKFFELSQKMPQGFKLFCEIGFGQKDKLEELLEKNRITKYSFYKDYNGIDRIMEAEI